MITIVACHYRLPEYRLRQFLAWNREEFEAFGVRVLIVSDVDREDLPSWARLAIYPLELKIYSPARVSNYGIRLAGAGIICKTDIDCVFSTRALVQVADVLPGYGVNLPYFMANSFEEREKAIRWESTKGTMALDFSDWERISGYDERQEGYGLEDGDGYCRAMRIAKIKRPHVPFWHIAHGEAGAKCSQAIQGRRVDQWNRDSGFCPPRVQQNRRARRLSFWSSPSWGLPLGVLGEPRRPGPGGRDRTPPLSPVPGVPRRTQVQGA